MSNWIVPVLLLAFSVIAQANDTIVWHKVGNVGGWTQGNYTPVVALPNNALLIFGNLSSTGVQGEWNRQSGTWKSVGKSMVVIPYAAVYDEGPATYRVRTSAVQRLANGSCVAMLTTGNGYPTTDSYRPSWATSDDCVSWVYRGHLVIDGSTVGYGQTDTKAMIVNEAATAIDHAYPGMNRYVVYENYQDPIGLGTTALGLILVYSDDGASWFRAKDAYGKWIDVLPAGTVPLGMPNFAFPSAVRTPYGVHVIAADTYPATRLIHLFSCDGMAFHVIESSADPRKGIKGTNLTYDPTTNLIHAFTDGVHWTLPAKNYGC